MSGTIRSRMVKQQERHPEVKRLEGATGWSYECGGCGRYWPCPDRVAADDTLTDLNNATDAASLGGIWADDVRGKYVLIPDP